MENLQETAGFTDKCKYCENNTFIKCNECSALFCNNSSNDISHLIYHMVKTKHKNISLMRIPVSCKICNENNIFRLGIETEALDHFKKELQIERDSELEIEKERENELEIEKLKKI